MLAKGSRSFSGHVHLFQMNRRTFEIAYLQRALRIRRISPVRL